MLNQNLTSNNQSVLMIK